MSCQPPYDYRPVEQFASDCKAPVYTEHRARLFAGGTYFRSIEQGPHWNDVSLEIEDNIDGDPNKFLLTVRYRGVQVETYETTKVPDNEGIGCSTSGIGNLRNQVNATSEYIEMYSRSEDIFDTGGEDASCISAFQETYMSGASGPPLDDTPIARINTGPERTVIIVGTTENEKGQSVDPPAERKVQQWDGEQWVSYQNLVPGACPLTTLFGGITYPGVIEIIQEDELQEEPSSETVGHIFAIGDGNFYKINPDTFSVVDSFSTGITAETSLMYGDGYFYIGASWPYRIYKVDPTSMSIIDTFNTDAAVWDLSFGSDGYLYSIESYNGATGSGPIRKIDPTTMSQANIYTGFNQSGKCLEYASDGYIYAGWRYNGKKIDPSNMNEVDSIGLEYNSITDGDEDYIYVFTSTEDVKKIYKPTFTELDTISLTGGSVQNSQQLAYYNGFIFATLDGGDIFKIDSATMSIVNNVTPPTFVRPLFISIDGYLYAGYVANAGIHKFTTDDLSFVDSVLSGVSDIVSISNSIV